MVTYSFEDLQNGKDLESIYYEEGYTIAFHRRHGNNTIIFYDDKGRYHRNNGPAYITFWEGCISTTHKKIDKILNNDHNPNYIDEMTWYNHGMIHNSTGPAYIHGNVKEWYINDKRCDSIISQELIDWME